MVPALMRKVIIMLFIIQGTETALIARREELQQKINEITAALQEIREDGYQAQDLEMLAERKKPEM